MINRFLPAPLPNCIEVMETLLAPSDLHLDRENLIWCNSSDSCVILSQSSWSLVAIILLRKKLINKDRIKVLCPSYFCNESLEILDHYGVDISYFKVTEKAISS
jgi:hypothetical protein